MVMKLQNRWMIWTEELKRTCQAQASLRNIYGQTLEHQIEWIDHLHPGKKGVHQNHPEEKKVSILFLLVFVMMPY